jgi:hypothetical protein
LVSVPCFSPWFGLSTYPHVLFIQLSFALTWLVCRWHRLWCPVRRFGSELNGIAERSAVLNMFGFSRRRAKLGRWILFPFLRFHHLMFAPCFCLPFVPGVWWWQGKLFNPRACFLVYLNISTSIQFGH